MHGMCIHNITARNIGTLSLHGLVTENGPGPKFQEKMLQSGTFFLKNGPGLKYLLNQARAGHTWFLRIVSVRMYALCVCPPPRLLITSGVMWCDIDPIRLVE